MGRYLSLLALAAGLVLSSGDARAETDGVRGRVIDGATGQPVPGAFVASGDAAALTDIDGSFSLGGLTGDRAELAVTADAYQPVAIEVTVGTDVTVELTAGDLPEGEVIEVEGEAPDTGEPPTYELTGAEVRRLPGSGNDALKALQSLPGVGRQPFGLGGLTLRGSGPRDTSVYLDGVRVPLLYHFGGLASFYPSTMLAEIDLLPGGYGAPYGRSQGGLVLLESKPGRSDRWRVGGEVGLIDAHARADGPGPLGGTWSVGLRRSYVDAILALALPDDADVDLTLAPRYYDGQVRFDRELAGGTLTASLFGADDRLQFLRTDDDGDVDPFRWQQSFLRAAVRYRKQIGKTDVSVGPWIGWDKNSILVGEDVIRRTSVPMGLRGEVGRVIGNGLITGGIDLSGGRVASAIDNDPPPMPGEPITDDEMNVQIENSRWYADLGLWLEGYYAVDGGRLGLRPGVRVDRFGFTDQWTFDPRLTVTHELPYVTLKESVGLYHQPPVAADLDPGYGNPNLKVSRSLQASIGAETALPGGVTVGVTNFYEQLYDQPVDVVTGASPNSDGPLQGGAASAISESLSEQFGTYSYRENRGRGQNYGVEVLTQRRGDRFFGWLAYTYARSFRTDDPRQTLFPRRYVLDQPHLVTALASVKLPDGWQTAARVRFASGNPYTPVAGSYYDAGEMEFRPIDGPTLSERLPAFFQLDLRVDRTWRRSWGVMSLYLDVQNVTNRRNVEGIEYDDDYQSFEYTRGLPIFPSIGVEYRQ